MWIEAIGDDFDAVFVAKGQCVQFDEVVAMLGGESLHAPHDGKVGAIEVLEGGGLPFGRIRIWAGACP